MNLFHLTNKPFSPCELVNETGELLPLLRQQGIDDGVVLSVQSSDPACWVTAWALARSAGHPFMPLAPELAPGQRKRLMEKAGSAVLINIRSTSALHQALSIDSHRPASTPAADTPVRLIIHTSGSEGLPRGVMHTQAGLDAASHAACERLEFGKDDLWLDCLAPWHIGGIAILERAHYCHARVLVLPEFSAGQVWRTLHEQPVTHISLVPAMLDRLLEEAANEVPPPHLRRVLIGGGPLSETLFQKAAARGWPLCISYGLSEAGSQAATLCTERSHWTPGDAGPALDGMEVRIRDPIGGVGPIQLRGPMMMYGYLNPVLEGGEGLSDDGWFQTSDIGRLDRRGHLHLLGRNDDLIVSGGVNVHPTSVERVLHAHPDVVDAAVVGTGDPVFGERVTALFVGDTDEASLISWCRERLPSAQRPRRFIQLDALPLRGIGKVDRKRLKMIADQA